MKILQVFMLWFNFILGSVFYFPLFLCMVMYDNEYKTKENKNWTRDKIEPQHLHYQHWARVIHLAGSVTLILKALI